MVGRPGKFQPRFTSGELDELIQQNTDLHIYGMGASLMQNVMVVPQGGFRSRHGTLKRGRLAGPTTAAPYVAGTWTLTAPCGGTPANPVTTPPTPLVTTATLVTGRNVVWRVNLTDPATRHISVVDIIGYSISQTATATISVESSPDGVTYTQRGPSHPIDYTVRARRFMVPQASVDGLAWWQIVVNFSVVAPPSEMVTINQLQFWSQPYGTGAGAVSTGVRVRPFDYTVGSSYDVVFTDGTATIYFNGTVVGYVATPYAGAVIAQLNVKQKLDTMLVFHQNYAPLRIMRQGADTEWNWDLVPFTNVPLADYGLIYANGKAAAWDMQFFGFEQSSTSYPMPTGGAHFTLTVNNLITGNILYPYPADYPTLINNIKSALTALGNIQPGFNVLNVSLPNTTIIRIEFDGTGNAGDSWAVSGKGVDKGDTAITANHAVIGKLGGEAIMSTTRGWPACGGFYAQRLLIGGFQGKPNYVTVSVLDDFFNFDTTLLGAEAALVLPLDTQGDEQVLDIHVGRNLMFLSNDAEYWMLDHSFDATVVPQIIFASRNGLAQGVWPVENEARTIYVHRNRGRFFEYAYSYPDQNYISTDISVQSASLVENIVDNALRKATSTTDTNTLFAVKGDGTILGLTLLRGQDVTAFARGVFQTDQVLSVDVNGNFDVNICTQRMVGGLPVQFLETIDATGYLDQAETHTLTPAGTLVTGLTDLEGGSVWALADGYWQGPFTVTGGKITLNFTATNVSVGRWTPPDAKTLPQPRDVAPRTVVRRPARVHTVRCTVVDTTSIAIGANDQPAWNIDLARFGGPVDTPMAPYTGEVVVEGILGYSRDAIVEITQMKPGALTVTGVVVEVDL
jgi:hypothetical protein